MEDELMKVDLNELAKAITLTEGGKISTNIAQVKEILSITLRELAKLDPEDLREVLNRYRQ